MRAICPAPLLRSFGPLKALSMAWPGRIDWKEFMDGAVRLKGQAKSMESRLLRWPQEAFLEGPVMDPIYSLFGGSWYRSKI